MKSFSYERATATEGAIHAGSARGAKFLAGGTNLVDLMKYGAECPTTLVDINHLALTEIVAAPDGGMTVGEPTRIPRPGRLLHLRQDHK
jgi:xanthine dehydrogenase YagS FAD-binding subunit